MNVGMENGYKENERVHWNLVHEHAVVGFIYGSSNNFIFLRLITANGSCADFKPASACDTPFVGTDDE